jgi:hypothetical protein
LFDQKWPFSVLPEWFFLTPQEGAPRKTGRQSAQKYRAASCGPPNKGKNLSRP